MGSLALLAREAGHQISGSDSNVYPPMSTQLEQAGIVLTEGYEPAQLHPAPDMVIIGNALSRGNPCIETLLEKGLPYTSGPQWLHDHILPDRWVLAVAGTHGKTTTASLLAWILDQAGLAPGFLIGGVPQGFDYSARLGDSPFFVIEADEYDTAFFDKRSKFVHYQPRTLILNNLEYDHADIFEDLAAIQRQFHHLVRLVPQETGLIIYPDSERAIHSVIEQGCWSETSLTHSSCSASSTAPASAWTITPVIKSTDSAPLQNVPPSTTTAPCLQHYDIHHHGTLAGQLQTLLSGQHNAMNILNAIVAARHVGIPLDASCSAIATFPGVKRRMELLFANATLRVYDDFAHHPTAIATTLQGHKKTLANRRIIAIIEPRSNTMRMGVHADKLIQSAQAADQVYWYQPSPLNPPISTLIQDPNHDIVYTNIDNIMSDLLKHLQQPTDIILMSNGSFSGLHQTLINSLQGHTHDSSI